MAASIRSQGVSIGGRFIDRSMLYIAATIKKPYRIRTRHGRTEIELACRTASSNEDVTAFFDGKLFYSLEFNASGRIFREIAMFQIVVPRVSFELVESQANCKIRTSLKDLDHCSSEQEEGYTVTNIDYPCTREQILR